MQALWSRIATQTRISCRCPSCQYHTAHGVARRPITAAGKRPKYAYSSTLFYSGIFAAAATTDAANKQRRRDRWDKAIAEVKQEIGEKEEDSARHEALDGQKMAIDAESLNAEVPRLEEEEASLGRETRLHTKDRTSPSADDQLQYQRQEQEQPEALLHNPHGYSSYTPLWPANTGAPLVVHNLPPQSEYALEHRRQRALHRLWTPKKLRYTELSIDRLVLRLLLAIDNPSQYLASVPDSFQSLVSTSRNELKRLLRETEAQLRATHLADHYLTSLPSPSVDIFTRLHPQTAKYTQNIDNSHLDTSEHLATSLESVFRSHKATIKNPDILETNESLLPTTLLKVAYNLSVSPAPPTLAVWTVLLRNLPMISSVEAPFSSLEQTARNHWSEKPISHGLTPTFVAKTNQPHPLATPSSIIIDCVFNTNTRLNEVALSAVLNHLASTSNGPAFIKVARAMKGEMGGLALARQDITVTETGGMSRLIRLESGKVIQNPYPTPKVFESLIKGVLHFAGFEAALGVCAEMGGSGWGLSIRGLLPLLTDCVGRGDWRSGEAVWRQMELLQIKSRRDGQGERVPRQAYVEALRMWLGKGEIDGFWETLRAGERDRWVKEELIRRVKRAETVDVSGPEGPLARPGRLHQGTMTSEAPEEKLMNEIVEQVAEATVSTTSSNLYTSTPNQPTPLDPEAEVATFTPVAEHVEPYALPILRALHKERLEDDTGPRTDTHENLGQETQQLSREHLDGAVAGTPELDDYEEGERPMCMGARQ